MIISFKTEITKIWYPVQEYSFWFGTLFKTGPQISVECFEHDAMLRHDCVMFWRARARTRTRTRTRTRSRTRTRTRLEVQGINTLFKTQTRELYTLFKTGIPENHTLSSGTSPYRKYRGVPPPPPPPPLWDAARHEFTGYWPVLFLKKNCTKRRVNVRRSRTEQLSWPALDVVGCIYLSTRFTVQKYSGFEFQWLYEM